MTLFKDPKDVKQQCDYCNEWCTPQHILVTYHKSRICTSCVIKHISPPIIKNVDKNYEIISKTK